MARRILRRFAKKTLTNLRSNDYLTLNRIEVSREKILHNVALIRSQHDGFEIIPVLKGNAYGHGLEIIAEILNGSACRYIAVDGYFEASKIRDSSDARILVMGYIRVENVRLLDTLRCSFVVQDIEGLKTFGKLGKKVRIHLELDTGFNRLGLHADELSGYIDVLKKYKNLSLEGIMTHLVDADNADDDSFDVRQQQLFDNYVKRILDAGFNPSLIHIAQTAGSTKIRSAYANAIRLGVGAYGINPLLPGDPRFDMLSGLRPALELKSTIIKVINLNKGNTVSYNATFTAPKPMRIGVLPLGYYEGVQRALSNAGCATHGDAVLPIVGRVCMNHTIIDLGQTNLQVGDEVTLISNDPTVPNSVAGLQNKFDLFAYETLTRLSDRVRRIIVQ